MIFICILLDFEKIFLSKTANNCFGLNLVVSNKIFFSIDKIRPISVAVRRNARYYYFHMEPW